MSTPKFFQAFLLIVVMSTGSGVNIKTGLEFLRPETSLNLNMTFFKEATSSEQDHGSFLDLVRVLIRNLKGLPFPLPNQGPERAFSSNGTNIADGMIWCFNSYLLSDLAMVEIRIYKRLHPLYNPEAKNITPFPALTSYLIDIEESSVEPMRRFRLDQRNKGLNPFLDLASHPLMIYRLIRRFVEDLPPILSNLETTQGKDYLTNLRTEILRGVEFFEGKLPTSADLYEAWGVITRTQNHTMLSTNKYARGILGRVKTGVSLTMLHILEIGTFYLSIDHFDYALEWIHLAVKVGESSMQLMRYPQLQQILNAILDRAISQHNNKFHKMYWEVENPWVFSTLVKTPFDPKQYTRRIEQLHEEAVERRSETDLLWTEMANFRRLCSGENLQTETERHDLKCWYDVPHKYWLIGPLKTELHNVEPRVVQIYQFLHNTLINQIISAAKPEMDRSRVQKNSLETSVRSSVQSWINDFESEGAFMVNFTRKLELLTGLTIYHPFACDDYQVAAYSPSNFYMPHHDAYDDDEEAMNVQIYRRALGNRLTTVMGYLNNVNVGGRTVFPHLGISIAPVKGSIVMWDNLKRNGDRDSRNLHGGCPVVLGIKWITNKWIYNAVNFLNRKCSLDHRE